MQGKLVRTRSSEGAGRARRQDSAGQTRAGPARDMDVAAGHRAPQSMESPQESPQPTRSPQAAG